VNDLFYVQKMENASATASRPVARGLAPRRPTGGRGRRVVQAVAILACAAAFAGCARDSGPPPPPPGAVPAGTSLGGAVIRGSVRFEGKAPPRKAISMTGEAACHKPNTLTLTEDVIVAPGGGLRNVYVHVVSGLGDRVFAAPASPAVMDQAGCMFVPHVLAVQSGQAITFQSSDPVLHNVRAVAKKNRAFNVSMPGKGKSVNKWFSEPEVVAIRCDVHAWMSGFIAVEGHPFHQVTGPDGSFSLEGLPAGEYVVEAWHEKLGAQRQTVKTADGQPGTIEFIFPARTGG
jgi:plastocyanin